MVVIYTKGLSARFKNICSKDMMQVHFKGGSIFKNFLVASKDKDTFTQKSGVMHKHKCDRVECDQECIGEYARMFGEI